MDGVGGDLATYHRAGADDTALAQDGAVQDDAVGADPDIIFYHDATPTGLEALVADQFVARSDLMIGGGEGAVGGDTDMGAEPHAVAGIDHGAGVDDGVAADDDVAAAAGRLDLNESVYYGIVL